MENKHKAKKAHYVESVNLKDFFGGERKPEKPLDYQNKPVHKKNFADFLFEKA